MYAEFGIHLPMTTPEPPTTNTKSNQKATPKNGSEAVKFSTSVAKGIKEGFYTEAQIEILKQQKAHLKATIASAQANVEPRKSLLSKLPGTHAIKAALSLSTEDAQRQEMNTSLDGSSTPTPKSRRKAPPSPPCNFQCCHTCRPALRDRTFVSFESVFAGEVRPMTAEEFKTLPIANANLLRNLRLPSSATAKPEQTDESSKGLTNLDDSEAIDDSKASEDNPLEGKDDVRPEDKGDTPAATSQDTVSTIMGPDNQQPAVPDTGFASDGPISQNRINTSTKTTESTDDVSYKSCEGEVEVKGGVALTEEAVETKTPDIVTQSGEGTLNNIEDDPNAALIQSGTKAIRKLSTEESN
ncbi:MAG: hypothetical protein M1821_000373 [Bathelium mastoideum]|nr:MAG: hypothetical protein M1821_000373 [Bathelium mastoideum]